MFYAIIMAGGVGTRLWPISTKGKPKQVYSLLDNETLLQKTWQRMRKGFPAGNILVSTGQSLSAEVSTQLKDLPYNNLVVEPSRKGTAPALGLVLLHLYKRDPKGIFVYINADNFVKKEDEFIRLLRVAAKVVKKKPEHILLVGVNPTYPETGYGYIKMGLPILKLGKDEVFGVKKFVEKPDIVTAKKFLRRWEYLWNPTLIVARCDHFLGLYKKYLPVMWRQLRKGEFEKITPETIDYGILEKEKNMLVLPGNFGWTDVGHWRAVQEILDGNKKSKIKDKKQNFCKTGKCISIDSSGNLVYSLSGKLVALAGVKNMILIESENALLLCPKSRAQDVKKLVENLEKKGMKEYL